MKIECEVILNYRFDCHIQERFDVVPLKRWLHVFNEKISKKRFFFHVCQKNLE